tara:strand:+ start:1324 stop:2151 length:828 start_codon:yes stop_codon:yes gene_type:complete
MNKKTFIVPHDFTKVADIALEHAIATAKTTDAKVQLLHVVAKKNQIHEANIKLEEIVEKFKSHEVDLIPNVRIGSIFEDIGDFASEHEAKLIFMGTHGAHGWQHVTGSHALKVVTNSSVPFIIVQEKLVKPTGYDSIVVPMDLNKETKQKLTIVSRLAKYFGSQVHVVIPDETDDFLKHQVKSNIVFAQRFFKHRKVDMKHTLISRSGFDKEVVKYAVSVDADLIAIMNLNKNNFLNAITANYEQYIITNDALIPALIVNPVYNEGGYGQSILFS